jgi:hypothetical protein
MEAKKLAFKIGKSKVQVFQNRTTKIALKSILIYIKVCAFNVLEIELFIDFF